MRILILGGCGFIGSSLAVSFAVTGHQVVCMDNLSRPGSEWLMNRVQRHGCEVLRGDIRNPEDFNKIRIRPDVMIDCSAEPSAMMGSLGTDARYVLEVNLVGALNCFEWARAHGTPILFLSTSRVYPYKRINDCRYRELESRYEIEDSAEGIGQDGVGATFSLTGARSLYGATKLSAEIILQEYAAQYGVQALINRCGVIAGPWQLGKADQGIFTFWMSRHYFKQPLSYIGFGGKGKQVRDLLHVDDLVALVHRQLALLETEPTAWNGAIHMVGGGRDSNLSLRETTALCAEITGTELTVGSDADTRSSDIIWYISDIRETCRVFDWAPTHKPKQILEDTFQWIRKNEDDCRKLFCGGPL